MDKQAMELAQWQKRYLFLVVNVSFYIDKACVMVQKRKWLKTVGGFVMFLIPSVACAEKILTD